MQTFNGEAQGSGALYDKICPKSPKRIRRSDGHLCVAEKGKEKKKKDKGKNGKGKRKNRKRKRDKGRKYADGL